MAKPDRVEVLILKSEDHSITNCNDKVSLSTEHEHYESQRGGG